MQKLTHAFILSLLLLMGCSASPILVPNISHQSRSPIWQPLPLLASPVTYGDHLIDSRYLRQVVVEYEGRLNELSTVYYTTKCVPLAGTDGTAIPVGVTRPGWVLQASEYSSIELPDELNYVTIRDTSIVKGWVTSRPSIDPQQLLQAEQCLGADQLILTLYRRYHGHTLGADGTTWRTQYGNPRP